KILSAAYQKEQGEIFLYGEKFNVSSPKEAIDKGISVIYQEFNLNPYVPIYENILLGKEQMKGMVIDRIKMIEKSKEVMNIIGLDLDPRTLVKDLSIAQKQMVEICKALSSNVRVLVLDEPTAAITDKETDRLFEVVRKLKSEGIGIVYISHRMSELFEIGDRVTVLRDGHFIKTLELSQTNTEELTRLMVNREVTFERIRNPYVKEDEIALEVEGLYYGNLLKDVSFKLKKGELLGIAGLVGSGRTETAKCIIGAYRRTAGKVTCKNGNVEIKNHNIPDAIKNGIVYLSEDRKDEGLSLIHTVGDNIILPNLSQLGGRILKLRKIPKYAEKYMERLKVKAVNHLQEVKRLSGGNQQKVVVAKWVAHNANVYLFDEPTRGIDVGARDEIYNIMLDLLKEGASILMISSDLVEIMKMSNRIIVMRDGEVSAILDNDESLTQQDVLEYALHGGKKMSNKEITVKKNKKNFQSLALYIGTVAIILIFTLLCALRGVNYLTWNNITNIIVQSSIIGIIAIGTSVVIITGGIDLASGGMLAFNGILAAVFMVQIGIPVLISIILMLIIGCLIGYLTGLGISFGKLPPFIMTLGTLGMAKGAALALCNGQPISNIPHIMNDFANSTWFGIPSFAYCLLILYAIMIFVMRKTRFGRYVYALGGNAQAARLSGINIKRLEVMVYMLAGFFTTIASLMLLARLAYASPTSGIGYEMDAIASCVIGGIALSGGQGKLVNTLVGALILTILKNGLQMLDFSSFYQQIVTGIVIVVAVFADKAKERKAE
ncbi:MAG: ABC transporter permease subunit, partial [Christensenellales bacterium]